METTPRLRTARQVSDATGVSVRSLYELADKGVIPHYRFGRSIRFDLDEVLAATRVDTGRLASAMDDLSDAELYEALGLGAAA